MTHVLHRHTKQVFPVAARAEGCYIYDTEGKAYLDGSCGAAVSCLGHSNAQVRAAMHSQIDTLAFAHTGFFTNQPMEQLADTLVKHAPDGISHVYFISGGSEAVESAIKLARQYFIETNQPKKQHIIARWQSYHGNTLGALAAGGNKWRREPFAPLLTPNAHHVDPCYSYRYQQPGESLAEYGLRAANSLEAKILELGAENVAAFIAEPVVGATMGCVPAVEGYFKRIKQICEQYNVLLILDEVMCGMGRTGTLFACEQDGISADIITVAKGLGGGYQPIGAMLLSNKIYDAIAGGSGFFQHGHTYMGHPVACSAALAVLSQLTAPGMMAHVRDMGALLKSGLQERFADHPYVGDIRGKGLFVGVELVEDKASKTPFASSLNLPANVKKAGLAHGLMCYPMGGTINGKEGAHVMFAPPFIVEKAHIDELIEKFAWALDDVLPLQSQRTKSAVS